MKFIAILSAVVLLVALVGVGSLYMTANIYVESTGVITMQASARQEQFDALSEQLRLNAVVGTAFTTDTILGPVEDYQFCTYTVQLRNDCRIAAEMVEVQISPMAGDVLQVGGSPIVTVQPGESAKVLAVLLTDADMHAIREVVITYYMWGIPFTTKTTIK